MYFLKFDCSGVVRLLEDEKGSYRLMLSISGIANVRSNLYRESDDFSTLALLLYLLSTFKCRLTLRDYKGNHKIVELGRARIENVQYYRVSRSVDIVVELNDEEYDKLLEALGSTWFYFNSVEMECSNSCEATAPETMKTLFTKYG